MAMKRAAKVPMIRNASIKATIASLSKLLILTNLKAYCLKQ